jgi:acetolactate synthase-1/2/3 large subunit
MLYACRDAGIKIYDFRHESAAGNAADAYARMTGKPGVLITTAGPGITNALTPMAEAYETQVPIVHIGGASPLNQNESGPLQETDTVGAMSTYCKWCTKLYHADRIPEYLSIAFRHATGNRPGPVYLEIPMDLAYGSADVDTVYFPRNTRTEALPFGDPAYIQRAAELLANAKRPVMAIGETARFASEYGESVQELANYLKMPVLVQLHSRGVFADESENELFTLGDGAFPKADVILELCVDNSLQMNRGKAPLFPADGDAKIIQVHTDRTQIGYNCPADVGIVAGAGPAATQLLEAVKALVPPVTDEAWVEQARELTVEKRKPIVEGFTSTLLPSHPGRIAAEVAKFLDEQARDWHVLCDGGDCATWITLAAKAHYPAQVFRNGKLGTIGTSAGYVTGCWAADGKPVLYYVGDGSFGFYAMEFDTYVRFGIPVVCVISNDSGWGMIRLSQELVSPKYLAEHGHCTVDLAHMRAYETIPAMWGGVGVKVTHYDDIIPAIEKIRDSGLPGIVNVECNRHEMSPRTRAFAKRESFVR